jgi:hypothetical protein
MKKLIISAALIAAAASLNGQSFVAGWDFDGANPNSTTNTANWGAQNGSATLSWTHGVADFVTVFSNEFGISNANNSAAVNNSFSFLAGGIDSTTGFNEFSDNFGGAEQGFQSNTGDDTFSISFDGSGFTSLELTYAFASTQGGTFSLQTIDLSSFDGNGSAAYSYTPAASGVYDNFAITGTVVPEPSSFAAIAGVLALGFVALRRRR